MSLRNKNKNYAQQRFNRCELQLTISLREIGKGEPIQTLRASTIARAVPTQRGGALPRRVRAQTFHDVRDKSARVFAHATCLATEGGVAPLESGGRARRERLPFPP
jgi:hypothetical protein